MSIADRLAAVTSALPQGVELVAVSKYHPVEELMQAYDAGQRIFGENIAQELRLKKPLMPQDVQWHFLGHLQTNKVKYIAPFVSLIHSIDSLHLLAEVNRQALRCGRVIDCLLQLHVAQEETKFGFTFSECRPIPPMRAAYARISAVSAISSARSRPTISPQHPTLPSAPMA